MNPLFKRPQSSRPLRVENFIATRVSDPERGPQVRLQSTAAKERMLVDGELAIVDTPRGQQLATVVVDDAVPRGGVIVRDLGGVAPSEIVYVTKPDLDAPPTPARTYA